MKIYLDNCCYNRPFDDQSQLTVSIETQAKVKIQHDIRMGNHLLVTSYMVRFENHQNPYESRKSAIEDFIGKYTEEYVGSDVADKIELKASDIVKTGIKAKDAIHIACAIEAGCDYFITTDKRVLRYESNEVGILNPVDFIRLEGQNDE